MQQGGDKHGFVRDEQLAKEARGMVQASRSTHAEEWKDPQPSGEDQPDVDRDPAGTLTGAPAPGLDQDDVQGRSELARFLGLSAFPGTAEELLRAAESNSATDAVLDELRRLPSGQTFENVAQVWEALGGGKESRRF